MPEEQIEPLPVRLKYYTTLALGLISCVSCFIFMFMIPFFLEPSISTLVADFDPEPVICRTVFLEHKSGSKNCSWSSCRTGCTIDQYECDQIYVDYINLPFREINNTDIDSDNIEWAIRGVPIFVNLKACGYPPATNCSLFGDTIGVIGETFPCYYSRVDPSLLVRDYSWGAAVQSLILALILPNLFTGVSLGVLSYWWYPGCQKKDNTKYELTTSQAEEEESHGEEDDTDNERDDTAGLNDDDQETMIRMTKDSSEKSLKSVKSKQSDKSVKIQVD